MASKLYNVLNGLYNGLETCKENAKIAGFNVNEHTTIYDIANMFTEINRVEFMRNQFLKEWTRPSDWPDTEAILRAAPEMEGMHPRFIILFTGDTVSTAFDKYTTTNSQNVKSLGVKAIYTSDGTWKSIASAAYTHTWGEPVNGFHYAIGYSDVRELFRFATVGTNAVEIVFGDCKASQVYVSSSSIVSIRTLPDLIDPFMGVNYIGGTQTLRNVDLAGIKTLKLYSGSAYNTTLQSTLSDVRGIVSAKFNDLELLQVSPGYNTTHYVFCIPYLYLPKLKKMEYIYSSSFSIYLGAGSNSGNGTKTPGIFLDVPELEEITGYISTCLRGIYAPKLVTITGNGSHNWNGEGSSYYLPALKHIGMGTGTTKLCSDVRGLQLPALETADYISSLSGIMSGSLTAPRLYELRYLQITADYSSATAGCRCSGYCIDLPSLKQITGGVTGALSLESVNMPSIDYIRQGLDNITDTEITFPSTLTSLPTGALTNCTRLTKLNLPDNFSFSGLDLSSSTKLHKASLLNILNKLGDVTEDDDNTYEITFGATNIAKLTTEEWQVAIDKGWVITDLVEEASE